MAPHGNTVERVNGPGSGSQTNKPQEASPQQQVATETSGPPPLAVKPNGSNRYAYVYGDIHKRRRAVSGTLSRKERRWELLLSKVPRSTTHYYDKEPFVFKVKDYLVIERLGAGSGGRVYLAKHEKTNQRVAIKVIEKVDARKERKARKEAGIMRYLHQRGCNNIVSLFDVIENEGSICIVMSFAEGGDLFEWIGRYGALEPSKAWQLFYQIVRAVAYAHSCGFIHRDLKPENIFLDKEGRIATLGDWGYAAAWSSWKKKRRPCGSLNYAASEIVSNKTYTGPEVDIFSLGGVLYTMLTGRLPFGSAVNRTTLQRVIAGKWRFDSALPSDVVGMLNRMFEPVPIRRATMMEVLQFVRGQVQKYNSPSPETSSLLVPLSPDPSFERTIDSSSVSDVEDHHAAAAPKKPSNDNGETIAGGVMKLDLAPALRDSAERKKRDDRQAREQLASQRVESPRESTNAEAAEPVTDVTTAATTPPSPDLSETCSRASKKPLHDGELCHTVDDDDDLMLRPCPRAANCV
jgi:serine/threonine protein kinase